MKLFYDQVCHQCSKLTTKAYSTSFSLGIRFLKKQYRQPIYDIYGFVRFADEIVDSFHDYNKAQLLHDFEQETYKAIADKISLNPILNSFQYVVNTYDINQELITTFIESMRMDLGKKVYSEDDYKTYILGSAEVVGLMCLKVFCQGDQQIYEKLKEKAMKLGSAFQKINFLRDLHADVRELGRMYFPKVDMKTFDETSKQEIIADIELDFKAGLEGIRLLPKGSRFGVYMAYVYYHSLLKKIRKTSSETILKERVRIPDKKKYVLFMGSYVKHRFDLI